MRMLAMLHQANQAPPEAPPSQPIRKTISRPKSAPAPRQRRPPTPQSESESESEFSDSGSSASSGSSSSYEDVETIYRHVVEDKKCKYVSPAGLKDKKTSKDAIAHLKAKNCPEVPALKKAKVAPPPAPTMAEAAAVRAPKKSKTVKIAESAPVEAAPAPAPPAATSTEKVKQEKPKRAPSAYNTFVAEQRKAGKSMAEAAAAWKAKKGS
jgi:hypothetical protein